jgi:hypothetical protein
MNKCTNFNGKEYVLNNEWEDRDVCPSCNGTGWE